MPHSRAIETEWLDHLPGNDPRALRARRDLKRINALMLQAGIMARLLKRNCAQPPARIVDLGSGDGSFMARVLHKLPRPAQETEIVLVDQRDIVSEETRTRYRALGYRPMAAASDIFAFLEQSAPADVICANLFLHHFMQAQLQHLFELAARKVSVFVACEPRRAVLPLFASRLLWAIGANDVTRHDARASVKAGFAGSEMSAAWPQDGAWQLTEGGARPFTHCFAARRSVP